MQPVSVFLALVSVSPIVAAQVNAWGQCKYYLNRRSSAHLLIIICKVVALAGPAELVVFQGKFQCPGMIIAKKSC